MPSLLDKGKTKKRRITNDHSLTPTDPQNNAPPPQIDSTPPTFAPIIPRCPPHSAFNTLPVRTQHQHAVELMDILNLFLTAPLIEQITVNTNAYATLKIAKREREGGREWKELLVGELRVWLGIIVYMGVHCSPAVKDYWKHDGLNPTHPIRDYMGLTRFEEIKRHFHVTPPDAPRESATGRRLWHNKV